LKIAVCICLITAILRSVGGFKPKSTGGMTPPNLLMKEHYYDSEENCKLVIVKTWIEALDELETVRDNKAKVVDKAIIAIGFAATLAAFDIIVASLISILG
jgi:hypothetical protein